MQAWCKERLAPFKVPTSVEFRQELPKTTVGKILRRELVRQDREKQPTPEPEPVGSDLRWPERQVNEPSDMEGSLSLEAQRQAGSGRRPGVGVPPLLGAHGLGEDALELGPVDRLDLDQLAGRRHPAGGDTGSGPPGHARRPRCTSVRTSASIRSATLSE